MINSYLTHFNIKTDDTSIDRESRLREKFVQIIRERYQDDLTPENYSTEQLQAWAEFGNPRAYAETQYSYDPVFYEVNGRVSLPSALDEKHAKQQDLRIMRDLGISVYTQRVYRSQVATKASNNERHLNRIRRTLVALYPILSEVLDDDLLDRIHERIFKLQFKSVAAIMARVVYRLAQSRGTYLDLGQLCSDVGIPREIAPEYIEIVDDIIEENPSFITIANNLTSLIKADITNLLQVHILSLAQAAQLNAYIDRLDPTCYVVKKTHRSIINLMLIAELVLDLEELDELHHQMITQLVDEDTKLFYRNLKYGRKCFSPRFVEIKPVSVTHSTIYQLLRHEFGLPLPFNVFTSFTDKLMALSCSEELAAVLITKTIIRAQGIRSLITAVTGDVMDLLARYRSFMDEFADHHLFNELVHAADSVQEPEVLDRQQIISRLDSGYDIPLPHRNILPSNMVTHLGMDLSSIDRIIVVEDSYDSYPLAFLDIAHYLLSQGAWTRRDEAQRFLADIQSEYPSLYPSFFELIQNTPDGPCDDWGINLKPGYHGLGDKDLFWISSDDVVEDHLTSTTMVIFDNLSVNLITQQLYDYPVSCINGSWMGWHISNSILAQPLGTQSDSRRLLGHRGEIRRGLLSQSTAKAIIWLESEASFRQEMGRVFQQQYRIKYDLDGLIAEYHIIFLEPRFNEILEFCSLNIPIPQGIDVILPDVRQYLTRSSPLLHPDFDRQQYHDSLLHDLEEFHDDLQREMQGDIKAMGLEFQRQIRMLETNADLVRILLDDYIHTKQQLLDEQCIKTRKMIDRRFDTLMRDRTLECTEDILDRYGANYNEAMHHLQCLMESDICLGISVSAKSRQLYQQFPPFSSKDQLDILLMNTLTDYVISEVPTLGEYPPMRLLRHTDTQGKRVPSELERDA